MNCDELAQLLDLHLDGELPEEMERRIERHLMGCHACAYEVRTLEQTHRMLRESVAPEEASPGLRERAAARLQDAFASRLHAPPRPETARQWMLPFSREE